MMVHHWLEEAFGSPLRIRVLRVMCADPAREYGMRELARKLGIGPSSVRVALHSLMDSGLVAGSRVGNVGVYRLHGGKISDILSDLLDQEARFEGEIRRAVAKATPKGVTVLIFGSAARRDENPKSDLDILVIAKSEDAALEVSVTLSEALYEIGPARPSFISLSAKETREKRNMPWFKNAIREGILVAGPPVEAWT